MEIQPLVRSSSQARPVRSTRPEGAEPKDQLAPRRGHEGPPASGGTLTGDIRVHRVHSEILGNTRNFWVYLPPSYHEDPTRQFPVIYTHDGQNVFDRATAFGGNEWNMDEAAEYLGRNGEMREAIIVAVSNTADRMSEYTPVADPEYGGGQAEKYAHFLIDEVKPFIDSHYRTLPDKSNTAVMGSSLGGLVSLYLGFNHPGVFGVVGALSPSLWWAGRDMIKSIAEHNGPRPERIWLDMGTNEGSDQDDNGIPDTIDNLRALRGVLEDKGYKFGKDLFYLEVPGASHDEYSWSQRIDTVLSTLYPPR